MAWANLLLLLQLTEISHLLYQHGMALLFQPWWHHHIFASHPYIFFPAITTAVSTWLQHIWQYRRTGLPVFWLYKPPLLACLSISPLASPPDQRHLVKSSHFIQEYFLTPCPPCSAGMWIHINSNLETLKVEGAAVIDWVVSENEFAKASW